MIQDAFRNLNYDNLFCNFNEHIKDLDILDNHKYFLIKFIIEFYFKIKLFYEGKMITLHEQKDFIRRKLTKVITFSGQ